MTGQSSCKVFAAVVLLGLAGCAAAPPPSSLSPEPSAGRPDDGAAAVRPAAPPPRVKPPSAKPSAPSPVFPPESLKGLDEAAARRLLGAPAQQTGRPPARLWRYETPGCRLTLAFYPDVASQSWRVLSYETTPQGAAPLAGAACVGRLTGGRTP